MRLRWVLVAALGAAILFGTIAFRDRLPLSNEHCTAEVGQTVARVDPEQARWSALMAAIAVKRGMPARATTIAIATAFQESKIHNIDYGDRDSVGIFQQRPSQGWGSAEQILDPHYAIGKFYDGLAKVPGYTSMKITDAAQEVQRSAYPGAYADHEPDARALASALAGYSQAAFSCRVGEETGAGNTGEVVGVVSAAYGEWPHEINAETVSYPMSGKQSERLGWSLAHYLVANAARLDLESVSFDGRVWTAASSADGWQADESAASDRVQATVR